MKRAFAVWHACCCVVREIAVETAMSIGNVSTQAASAYAQQAGQAQASHGHRRHPDAGQETSWTQAQNQGQAAGTAGAAGLPRSALEPATATKVGQVLASSTSSKIVNVVV
jgi:hypothetical protein